MSKERKFADLPREEVASLMAKIAKVVRDLLPSDCTFAIIAVGNGLSHVGTCANDSNPNHIIKLLEMGIEEVNESKQSNPIENN